MCDVTRPAEDLFMPPFNSCKSRSRQNQNRT